MLTTAKKRQSNLIPVRLVCELDELINRVRNQNRQKYYKSVASSHTYGELSFAIVFSIVSEGCTLSDRTSPKVLLNR